MLLAVDVGNTQTHLGLWRGAELAHTWRIATRPLRTTDDLAVQLDGLLALRDLETAEVTALVVSSTVQGLAVGGTRGGPAACRSLWTTRARSGPTGSSMRSQRSRAAAARASPSTSARRRTST